MAGSSYREELERWFGHLPLEVDDLFLLERFQLLSLPTRAPVESLGHVLVANRRLRRFIEVRCPELAGWIDEVVVCMKTAPTAAHERALIWELADMLVYQRFPDAYDAIDELRWDARSLAEVCDLNGVVVDAGAGTGWLAAELAPIADTVYAVEPVGRLRDAIRDRAAAAGLGNLFAVDGFLHRLPLPSSSVDVLVTSRAIGWQLADELSEVERIVRPGGWAVHCLGTPVDGPHTELETGLESFGYERTQYRDGGGVRRRYAKRID